MVVYENQCCDCASPGYPCKGDLCSNRHVRVLKCDRCGYEVERLYILDGEELCEDCLLEGLETIE